MGLGRILLIALILMLVGVVPKWTHSRRWAHATSGGRTPAAGDPRGPASPGASLVPLEPAKT